MSGRGDIYTPWNRQTLAERCATVKDDCHSPRAAREADLAGAAKPTSAAAASNRARIAGLNVDPEALSERTLLFLKLVCAHHRCAPNEALERALSFYCNSEIGLQRCADLNGGEGV